LGAVPVSAIVERIRPSRGEPEGALVLFHGRGADEHDLLPLIEVLDPDQRLVGVTPRAPLDLGTGGWHWYVVPRVGHPDEPTFLASVRLLDDWLDGLPERIGVPEDRIVLGGFSQGCVMAYAIALASFRDPPAALLALVGYLPRVDGHPLDLVTDDRPPVAIAHGSRDPVIEVAWGRAARDELVAAGLDVDYLETPAEHTVDAAWLPALRRRIGMALREPGA
jgi:phospholipase/carboxylesterase